MAGETPGIRPGSTPVPTPTPAPRPAPAAPSPMPTRPVPQAAGDRGGTQGTALQQQMMGQTGAVPVPPPANAQAREDLGRIATSPVQVAAEQYGAAANQMQEAIRRFKAEGGQLKTGAEAYNLVELNQWVAHQSCENRGLVSTFRTGQEPALAQAIKRTGDGPPARKLSMADVFNLALKTTGGDVSKALLTTHNTLRALARPSDEAEHFGKVTDMVASNNKQGEAFMQKYLDGRSAGIRDPKPGESIGDDWYHTFVAGTVSYVGDQRGSARAALDAVTTTTGGLGGFVARVAALNAFGGKPGSQTAMLDAIGEQGLYGALVGRFGIGKPTHAEYVAGVEPGELLASLRGLAIGQALSQEV